MNRLSPAKIVVVEDDRSIQALISEALRPLRVDCVPVSNGRDAMPRILEENPGLVVLDIALPGMSGWNILSELRAVEQTSSIPVIIITAHGQTSWEHTALELGADRFIEKPFEVSALTDAVIGLIDAGHRPDARG